MNYKRAFIATFTVLIAVFSLFVYSTVAVPGPFTIPKPYTADLVPEVVFTVDSMDFHYVEATQQIDTCTVVVRNIHASESYAGTVTVTFKEGASPVATGSETFTAIAAGETSTVTVSMGAWTVGKTLANVDGGVVQVIAAT